MKYERHNGFRALLRRHRALFGTKALFCVYDTQAIQLVFLPSPQGSPANPHFNLHFYSGSRCTWPGNQERRGVHYVVPLGAGTKGERVGWNSIGLKKTPRLSNVNGKKGVDLSFENTRAGRAIAHTRIDTVGIHPAARREDN